MQPIKVNTENELLCPVCGSNFTHQSSVNVITRDCEDGPGTSAVCDESGVKVARVESEKIFGRRDAIEIEFWCESCGETAPTKKLIINQHKGCTQIQWANSKTMQP